MKKVGIQQKEFWLRFWPLQLPDLEYYNFFEEFDETVLLACCKRIDDLEEMTDEELSEFSKEDLVTGILNNIYTFGLQNLFSSFSVTELKEFCETCELSVKSSSKEVLVDCLIEQKDYRTKGSKVKAEKASKKKPDLKDGIKKVDLEQWYYRNELEEFCKDNGIKRGGNKREIIKRILLFFEGDKSSKVFPMKKKKSKRGSKGGKIKGEGSASE